LWPARRRLWYDGRWCLGLGRQIPPAAARATKQPLLGFTLLTSHEEGPRKGGLNIVRCMLTPTGNHARWASLYCSQRSYTPTSKTLWFATWNVRTLLDNEDSNRPARRTALVAAELGRYDIDIAALSETHLADEGSLTEDGGGYTFFQKGLPHDTSRIPRCPQWNRHCAWTTQSSSFPHIYSTGQFLAVQRRRRSRRASVAAAAATLTSRSSSKFSCRTYELRQCPHQPQTTLPNVCIAISFHFLHTA